MSSTRLACLRVVSDSFFTRSSRRRNCCSLGAMRADHPGSYLHLSQPMRLDARPSTYMWPRKQHDAVPGQATKLVQPSKSEWTLPSTPTTSNMKK